MLLGKLFLFPAKKGSPAALGERSRQYDFPHGCRKVLLHKCLLRQIADFIGRQAGPTCFASAYQLGMLEQRLYLGAL